MIVIVAGSRTVENPEIIKEAIKQSGFKITTLVSGGCRGVDQLAEEWAKSQEIPIVRFLPDWKKHGKAAGPIRNEEMAAFVVHMMAFMENASEIVALVFVELSSAFKSEKKELKAAVKGAKSGGLIAIWDGKSKGTANMIKWAEQYRLQVYISGVSPPNMRSI